jgi:hypothetical protein
VPVRKEMLKNKQKPEKYKPTDEDVSKRHRNQLKKFHGPKLKQSKQ